MGDDGIRLPLSLSLYDCASIMHGIVYAGGDYDSISAVNVWLKTPVNYAVCKLCRHDLDSLMLNLDATVNENSSDRPSLVGFWLDLKKSFQFYFVNVAYTLTFPKESRNVVIYQIWQCGACFRKDTDGLSD